MSMAPWTALGRRDDAGFTLLEMMVALAVAGILLATGVPSFLALMQSQRLTSTTNDFLAAILLARSEAIARGVRVDLVPAGADGDWKQGWAVFVDQNANQKIDGGEEVIFRHGPVPLGIAITSTFTDSAPPYLAYGATGRTTSNKGPTTPQAGNVRIAADQMQRKIVVGFLGRPRVCDPVKEPADC